MDNGGYAFLIRRQDYSAIAKISFSKLGYKSQRMDLPLRLMF